MQICISINVPDDSPLVDVIKAIKFASKGAVQEIENHGAPQVDCDDIDVSQFAPYFLQAHIFRPE